MRHFGYKNGEYHCEDVALSAIAEQIGTPFYCYSSATLSRHYKVFTEAFKEIPHIVCFAVKANSNIAVLNLLGSLGAGADIISGGELYRALKAGVDPKKIVYAGVGKTRAEIASALDAGILFFNVESSQELLTIDEIAAGKNMRAPVALRVNPDIDARTHPGISTGLKENKFGIAADLIESELERAAALGAIDLVGIHIHIGSQVTRIAPFLEALEKTIGIIERLKGRGIELRYINLGGGVGITYSDEEPPEPGELAARIAPLLKGAFKRLGSQMKVVFEPGRVIAGNAGALVTKVLYAKSSPAKNFFIVDAAMNDLIRPSIYGAYHGIVPISESALEREKVIADVVGPICESSDFLAKDRELPQFRSGDLMALMSAGAYAFSMSSNYNSRPRVAETLVRGSEYRVIRAREEYSDLIAGESMPQW